jgi:hypothetical protein
VRKQETAGNNSAAKCELSYSRVCYYYINNNRGEKKEEKRRRNEKIIKKIIYNKINTITKAS